MKISHWRNTVHAHTCTTTPTFANHDSQSAFELRLLPVQNEICQFGKQTGTGVLLPVAEQDKSYRIQSCPHLRSYVQSVQKVLMICVSSLSETRKNW